MSSSTYLQVFTGSNYCLFFFTSHRSSSLGLCVRCKIVVALKNKVEDLDGVAKARIE